MVGQRRKKIASQSHRRCKPKRKLPKRLIVVPNKDKEFHERWYKGRDELDIPHPFRAVCLGPPNCGKGLVVQNIIARTLEGKKPFEEIYCIHCDPDFTEEWDDVGATMMGEIPPPEEWEGVVKTLVIIDDLELKGLNKIQKRNLDRLYGFVSTHKNVSVILCSQDAFNVPPIVRRCSNLWVMWRCPDLDAMAAVSRKSGMSSNNFNSIFDQLMCDTHDSLWIDMTSKSPFPLRKNGYKLISKTSKISSKSQRSRKEEKKENLDKFAED